MTGPGLPVARATVLALVFLILALPPAILSAQALPDYEVWAIDQADTANGGNKLYIFQARQLSGTALTGAPEVVDLDAGAQGVGDGPGVRPHLLLFNNRNTHGILAAVASGHVLFIRARDRRVVGSVDVGVQAHGAVPSPDDSLVLVANQNGKRLARIRSDFGREQFRHEAEADLDLGALEDAEHPDNAPICPLLFTAGGTKVYITMRGGGLYVVDPYATPMRVVRQYGRSQVAPSGCGGIALGNKVYINSGTASSSDLYVFDSRTDALVRHISLTSYGTDGHGMVLTGNGRYLWVANRGEGDNIAVIDTQRDEVVNVFGGFGAAPDLLDIAPGTGQPLPCGPSSTTMCYAPGGQRVFIAMRGPNPLTGGEPARGERTGMAVLDVLEGGRSGRLAFFIPIGGVPADIHGIGVRTLAARTAPVQQVTRLPATGLDAGTQLMLLAAGLVALGAALRVRCRAERVSSGTGRQSR